MNRHTFLLGHEGSRTDPNKCTSEAGLGREGEGKEEQLTRGLLV